MRDIADRSASGSRTTRLALTALATVATVAAMAPAAMAAGSVSIKTAFENSPISLNTSDAVGYALSNSSGATQTVTFTDTLPAGVTLDNPVGTTNTNGTGSCTLVASNATAGASSVTLTVTVPNNTSTSSSTVCTISFSIVASAPSTGATDTYSGYSTASGFAVTTPTPASLAVLSSPSLSFTAPASGQSFSLGQIADAGFACTATDPKDSIDSFFGTDDEGNQIESGAPIDTLDPGSHTLTVECYSAAGGGFVSQSVTYTVGSYALSAVRAGKTTDIVTFKTTVPAGKLIAKVVYGKKLIGTTTASPTSAGQIVVGVKPTSAGKKLLAGLKGRWANLRLQTSLNPLPIGTGDQEITPAGATVLSRTVKLPLAHPAKRSKAARKAGRAKQAGTRAPARHAGR